MIDRNEFDPSERKEMHRLWDEDAMVIVMSMRFLLRRLDLAKLSETRGNWAAFNYKYFAYKRGPYNKGLFLRVK
jgi:hypothetical protein